MSNSKKTKWIGEKVAILEDVMYQEMFCMSQGVKLI